MDSLHLSKYHITTLAECNPCSCSGPTSQVVDNGDPKNLLKEKHTMPINFPRPIKMLGDGHTVTIINVQSKLSSPHIYNKNPGDDERPSTPIEYKESSCYHDCGGHIYQPILPWINGDGSTNSTVYEGLSRRVIGYVMHYPGVMEVCLLFFILFFFNRKFMFCLLVWSAISFPLRWVTLLATISFIYENKIHF